MLKGQLDLPFVRSAYNYDMLSASDESALLCADPSLAQQNFKEDCDINNILAGFLRTGEMPGAASSLEYGDFTGSVDYHESMNRVIAAQDAFASLNANVRSRFSNDPAQFLDFVSNPENRDEAIKLGLISLPKAPLELPNGGSGELGKVSKKPSVRAPNEPAGGTGDE